jgi:hypothetical protein
MISSFKEAWIAALRDPIYQGQEDWQFICRTSLKGGQRFNVFGILYEVMRQDEPTKLALDQFVLESYQPVRLKATEVGRGQTMLLVLALQVAGDPVFYLQRLPAKVEALVGLHTVRTEALKELMNLNRQQVPFSDLADYINKNF